MTRAALIFATLALLALLAVLPSLAWAPLTVDLDLLREIICQHETQGKDMRAPLNAFGNDGELGRCQIKPLTAYYMGGLRERTAIEIVNTLMIFPEPIAGAILSSCDKNPRPHRGAFGLAILYNSGCRFRGALGREQARYAKQVAINYANAIFARRLKAAGLKQNTHD